MNASDQSQLAQLVAMCQRRLEAVEPEARIACKVCEGEAECFDVVDFRKTCHPTLYPSGLAGLPVHYHRCRRCGLLFTTFFDEFTAADWRRHIYNDDYVKVDPDYLWERPTQDARRLDAYLRPRRSDVVGIDYGGGAGIAARLMRALGYRYDSFDPYGQQSMTEGLAGRYNFCSSFEVAEHSAQPLGMFESIMSLMHAERCIVFVGTQVSDGLVDESTRANWWYVAPRNGHVTIYSRRSLALLAERFKLAFHSYSRSTHFMVRGFGRREMARLVYPGVLRRRTREALGLDPLRAVLGEVGPTS